MDRGLPRSHSMLMAELALEPISPDYQSKASSSWTTQVPPSLAVISRKATPPHTHPLASAQIPEPFLLHIRLVLQHLTCFLKVVGDQRIVQDVGGTQVKWTLRTGQLG